MPHFFLKKKASKLSVTVDFLSYYFLINTSLYSRLHLCRQKLLFVYRIICLHYLLCYTINFVLVKICTDVFDPISANPDYLVFNTRCLSVRRLIPAEAPSLNNQVDDIGRVFQRRKQIEPIRARIFKSISQ